MEWRRKCVCVCMCGSVLGCIFNRSNVRGGYLCPGEEKKGQNELGELRTFA